MFSRKHLARKKRSSLKFQECQVRQASALIKSDLFGSLPLRYSANKVRPLRFSANGTVSFFSFNKSIAPSHPCVGFYGYFSPPERPPEWSPLRLCSQKESGAASAHPGRCLPLSTSVISSRIHKNRPVDQQHEFVQEFDNFIIVACFMRGVVGLLRPARETPRAIASSSVPPKQPGVGCGTPKTTHAIARLTQRFPARCLGV